jgi:hypothetical protein
MSHEYNKVYFDSIDRLFGGTVVKGWKLSFISDKMIFNKTYIEQMLKEIERHCKCYWIKAIETMCPNDYNNFSEYETYGSWFFMHKGIVKMVIALDERFCARQDTRLASISYSDLKRDFGQNYWSITQMKY